MKTYIFIKYYHRKNNLGYYELVNSRIMGVYTDYDKAIAEAEEHMHGLHEAFGGIITEELLSDNKVFHRSMDCDKSRVSFIVEWYNAK